MGYYKDPTGTKHYKTCDCENNDCELDRLNTNVTSSLKSGTHKARVNCKTCGAYIKFASNKDIKYFVYPDGETSEAYMLPTRIYSGASAHEQRIHDEETDKLSNSPNFRTRKKRE